MKIDLSAVLENEQGGALTEPKQDEDDPKKVVFKEVSLRGVIYTSLLANDAKATSDEKVNRFLLFKKVQESNGDAQAFELTAKEAALIQDRVGVVYASPLIVGQAFALLEG